MTQADFRDMCIAEAAVAGMEFDSPFNAAMAARAAMRAIEAHSMINDAHRSGFNAEAAERDARIAAQGWARE